jgi:hypothetical protein
VVQTASGAWQCFFTKIDKSSPMGGILWQDPARRQRSGLLLPPASADIRPPFLEDTMNSTAKKLIAAIAVAAFATLGSAVPAQAAAHQSARTIWCC